MTPWTISCKAPLSMRFPRQEYWSGLPFTSSGDLDSGIESTSSALVGGFFTPEPPGKPRSLSYNHRNSGLDGSFEIICSGLLVLEMLKLRLRTV